MSHLIRYVQRKENIKYSPGCGWPHVGMQMTQKATLTDEEPQESWGGQSRLAELSLAVINKLGTISNCGWAPPPASLLQRAGTLWKALSIWRMNQRVFLEGIPQLHGSSLSLFPSSVTQCMQLPHSCIQTLDLNINTDVCIYIMNTPQFFRVCSQWL